MTDKLNNITDKLCKLDSKIEYGNPDQYNNKSNKSIEVKINKIY